MNPLDGLGLGIGWRPEIAGLISDLPGCRFVEVVAESLCGGQLPAPLAALIERGVTVVPHGTRLSLGGTDPLDRHRVADFVASAAAVRAPLVSEHVAFVRAGGLDAGHLLPLPRTREALDVLAGNIAALRAELDVPLALEPIATLFDWPEDELTEADFLTELLTRTDCLLLLDVANVYANARNRGTAPAALLDRLPLDRIAYLHVAGGTAGTEWSASGTSIGTERSASGTSINTERSASGTSINTERSASGTSIGTGGRYHDTHTDPTPAPVLELLGELTDRLRATCPAAPPPPMLERDGRFPPAAELHAELDAIARAAATERITRSVE
jgi:hypothetical protein